MFGKLLCLGAAVLPIGLSAADRGQLAGRPAVASADTANEGKILVTARRYTERLIDVPASVSVLTR